MEWYDWILTENCCAAKNTDSADELIPSIATVPLIVRTPVHAVRKNATMMSSMSVLISETRYTRWTETHTLLITKLPCDSQKIQNIGQQCVSAQTIEKSGHF